MATIRSFFMFLDWAKCDDFGSKTSYFIATFPKYELFLLRRFRFEARAHLRVVVTLRNGCDARLVCVAMS